jgi:hypothetical protein|tara:strand:+ start:157 stop:639 length:483 start_codon:yes stop_codon:yes gene_type:complete
MSSKKHKIPQKLFVLKTYKNLSQIETVLINIAQKNDHPFQLSILAKLTSNKNGHKKLKADIKKQLSTILGAKFQLGFFFNPEIGSLFIAGHLTPMFLTKVNNKELASLPAGISALFRGLGINTKYINGLLTELKNNSYCLIIRGERTAFTIIESILNLHS